MKSFFSDVLEGNAVQIAKVLPENSQGVQGEASLLRMREAALGHRCNSMVSSVQNLCAYGMPSSFH